ncbi:MAG: hypothetical protein ACM336_00325 [Acidobacteriota bacterium]
MLKRSLFSFAAVAAALLAAGGPGPAPRFDAWKVIGPGGGGTMIGPTISPHDTNLVVEHCDMTGAYITHDAGQSWRMFNLRTVVQTFAFDPKNPRVIYAGNMGLWRSEDTGKSWRLIYPRDAVEHQLGDHSDVKFTSRDASYPSGRSITAIAVDPANPKRIHIAFGGGRAQSALVLESTDGGASFKLAREFPGERVLVLHHGQAGLIAVGSKTVARNSGRAWESSAGPEGGVEYAAAAGHYIYAATREGALAVSEDGGRTWTTRTPALGQQAGRFQAVAASGQTAYLGFRGLKLGEGRENLYNGIAKSTDGGHTWSIVFRESTAPATNLDASWIEGRARDGGHDIWYDAPYSLGAAPGNPDVCYATDLFRTYRTLDGGKTWAQVNSVRAGNGWTTRGLDVTTNYGVHFDPFDVKHILIDYTDIGAFHSFDGGNSWVTATTGVPQRWRNTTYWVVFDPDVKGLLWGAFSGVHDLPRPKMWRGRDPLRYVGGVGVSTDGGRTWTPSNDGMPETSVTHLLLDPTSPAGRRTLYATGFGRGVYKSTDNGKTWTLKNKGIEGEKPFAWRITRAKDGTLYLIVARNNNGRFGEPGTGALYKSVDGAETWTKMALPEGCNGPNGLTLDPRDNRRMYLSAWGQERPDVDTGGGVFLSTDAGASWKLIFGKMQHVYDVTVDPRNADVLYACGFDSAAYRSADAGRTWTRIRGYNFKWGHRVIPDPNDASKIYITTYGGSVWHGPALGDPKALEDIVNPAPIAE